MAQGFLLFLFTLAVFRAVSGQQQQDDCLMKCMQDFQQKNVNLDAMKIMQVQKVEVGNTTAMCPRMNDTSKMDSYCGGLRELFKCTDACPDSEIKKMTMGGFKSAKFMCVDRFEDMKKNMPCMSEHCPEVQRECVPKCGSIEEASQKIVDFMGKVHGGGGAPHAPPSGTIPPGAGAGGQDVDMSQISKFLGQTCTTMMCFSQCSEPLTTKLCGKDAYLLQRDLIWNMFAGVAQSMSSMGLQSPWPEECKPLARASAANASAEGEMTPIPGTGAVAVTTPAVTTPAVTTPAVKTTPPAGTTPEPAPGVKSGKATKLEEKGKGATSIIASGSLVLTLVAIVFFGSA